MIASGNSLQWRQIWLVEREEHSQGHWATSVARVRVDLDARGGIEYGGYLRILISPTNGKVPDLEQILPSDRVSLLR